MYTALLNYINTLTSTPLLSHEFDLIKDSFRPKKLRKKQYLLQEGEICKNFSFIVKGATRQYLVDKKGVEHIVHLGIENWWVGDRESWVMHTPSAYCIDAWEDTEFLTISRADTLRLAEQCPAFNEMIRMLDERNNIASQRRIASAISNSAEQRYTDFVIQYPEFLKRFPQHIIASYLGITKDTLSRVRKLTVKK